MILHKNSTINHDKGLHTRVLAMVVHKASELEIKYNIQLFITYKKNKKISATSILPLVLLKIKKNEKVTVEAIGENPQHPLNELCEYLESDFNLNDVNAINQIDNILNNNTISLGEVKELKEKLQKVLETVQDGICVLDAEGLINYVNKSYLRILNESEEKILGKNIRDISPNGTRSKVLKNGKSVMGVITRKANGITIVSNVNPIIVDNKITGVVSVIKNITEVQELSEKLRKASEKADYYEHELLRTKKPSKAFSKYIGESGKVLDTLAIAFKAARTNANVIIRGESGTGKELIAEGIHFASDKSKGPFVRVNCAAIPQNLLESELFGHEKGAFTGAIKRRQGKFELAQKGTIFLDEIGEMDISMQAKILRVIQEKEFQRIGGEETIKVDVRIIAATHRNLEKMIESGDFREDLYYRLNVIPVFIYPLRERKQDIALLLEHFLNKIGEEMHKKITVVTNDAMEAMLEYIWPGNVRELENLLERIMALNETGRIDLQDLPPYISNDKISSSNSNQKIDNLNSVTEEEDKIFTLKEYEKIIIEKALKKYGSYNAAGKALGITHKTVAAKAKLYNIEKKVTWE